MSGLILLEKERGEGLIQPTIVDERLTACIMSHQIGDITGTLGVETMSSSDQTLEKEKRAFQRIRPELLSHETYRNKFVAITDGKVVDVDSDRSLLVERVYSRCGYIPFYVGQVTEAKKMLRRLPSPRRM